MTITVSKLVLKNYRSCPDLIVEFSRYTALVGYNNSGKSNLLAALSWLLKKYSLPAAEFWDEREPVSVSGELKDIDEADLALLNDRAQAQIAPFIVEGTLTIRRSQPHPDAKASELSRF